MMSYPNNSFEGKRRFGLVVNHSESEYFKQPFNNIMVLNSERLL